MFKNDKRNSNATLKTKQQTVAIYHSQGIHQAVLISGYKDKTIYSWDKQFRAGTLSESKAGRPKLTKQKIITELNNPNFLETFHEDDKDELIKLMRELLL